MAESVRVVAVQYTDGAEPVTIQITGTDPTGVLYGVTRRIHTTQAALFARMSAELRAACGDRWGGPETTATIVEDCATRGLTVTVGS